MEGRQEEKEKERARVRERERERAIDLLHPVQGFWQSLQWG
jgi:hypothetical protein